MDAREVEAIERATLAAVAPQAIEALPDWLLPFESGPIGRAKAAVPIRHARLDPESLAEIEARYRARGLAPSFRLAEIPDFEPLREALSRRGFSPRQPTSVQRTSVERMLADAAEPRSIELHATPDAVWSETFAGAGSDPLDGAQRVAALAREPSTLFASVRANGRALAVGAASFGYGFMCVHAMRTDPTQRRQGLARSILLELANRAHSLGVQRAVLQVECDNTPALTLYRNAGFEPAWTYRYWRE
jgi:N-acetylglutamate synthase